ncbi:hypothetical protein LGK97_02685 [Clostridium sp. CS001]|uniref:hypothetical protein n=1 Tax=Clostridium sp. CS001 TaxID=2880648 RepID=UPI001CF46EA8|nr:hypothetical protein [Clostridium sp. CS001]MCB2288669.1 hypothetical protein [Clostridium sp. CS001]
MKNIGFFAVDMIVWCFISKIEVCTLSMVLILLLRIYIKKSSDKGFALIKI